MYEEEEVKRVSPKCFFRVVRGKDSRIGGSRMCAFFNFQGGFCNFPISISPRPSNETYETARRVCKAKKKIDRADLLATTHREINSFFLERKYKTYPAISRLLPMRMQRNSSSFGRRDDETEDRKEIYLSILFFSNFSPLVLEKLHTRHHHA